MSSDEPILDGEIRIFDDNSGLYCGFDFISDISEDTLKLCKITILNRLSKFLETKEFDAVKIVWVCKPKVRKESNVFCTKETLVKSSVGIRINIFNKLEEGCIRKDGRCSELGNNGVYCKSCDGKWG